MRHSTRWMTQVMATAAQDDLPPLPFARGPRRADLLARRAARAADAQRETLPTMDPATRPEPWPAPAPAETDAD